MKYVETCVLLSQSQDLSLHSVTVALSEAISVVDSDEFNKFDLLFTAELVGKIEVWLG